MEKKSTDELWELDVCVKVEGRLRQRVWAAPFHKRPNLILVVTVVPSLFLDFHFGSTSVYS